MSSDKSTPTRPGRGVPLDIDTDHGFAATAYSLGGFLTPPQSAHESRRGSLQYSSYSESFSHPSSLGAFTSPPTPVHYTGQQDPFAQAWAQHGTSHDPMASDMEGSYMDVSMPQDVLHSGVSMSHCGQAESARRQSAYDLSLNSLGTAHSYSPGLMYSTNNTMVHDTSLNMTLFQSPPGMIAGPGSAQPSYNHPLSVDSHFVPQYGYEPVTMSYTPGSQIIVPSQLSSDDAWSTMAIQCSEYASPGHRDGGFSSGTASVNTSFSSYDSLTPSSPDAYLMASEDEYLLVKHEAVRTPSPRLRSRTSGVTRARKRGNKRGKPNPPRAFWTSQNGTEVLLEGNWRFEDRGKAVPESALPSSKPHQCPQCVAKFERSEHLKRHQKTHSESREYTCPLPGCEAGLKGISRSDNATDHFKTHLKGPRKGQRNKHFEYPVLRNLLLDVLPPKDAHKMIVKLEKACREDHELRGQRDHVL